MFFLLICLIRFAAKGRSTNDADAILKVATSSGFRAINPFFIKIKELPQITDKIRKIIKMRHDDVVVAMTSGGVDIMEKFQYMLDSRRYQIGVGYHNC